MRRLMTMFTFLAAPVLAQAQTPADYPAQIEQWHAARVERLQRPDGWLSLVGLHWLERGTHSVGSAADNAIVLATGPARLGTLRFDEAGVNFTPATDSGVSIDGQAATGEVKLRADADGAPNIVGFNDGTASFMLIKRGERYALRVRDAKAATRTGFVGIERYPVDAAWRIEARFEPHPPGKTIDIATVLNTIEPMANPGALVFEKDGKTHRLEAVDEGDGSLFLIFADRTNGRETYGPGRFLYAERIDAGRVVVDFNRAYNPPCAFNAYSTCPLPPPENRLDLAVTAGEKKYRGPNGQ